MTTEWQPITEAALRERIAQGEARMSVEQLRLWRLVRIEPAKWRQEPWGNQGGGFWAVGLIGQSVLWYNDIEEGFNRSICTRHGTIDDYFCNHDELEVTMGFLVSALERGADLVLVLNRFRKPGPAEGATDRRRFRHR